MSHNFFAGLSGLVLPMPRYKYPEPFQKLSRLTYYSSLFRSIEINRTFYSLPNGKTLGRWSQEVAEDFKFTFKLWKQITHTKNLHFSEDDVKSFMHAINNVGSKKGCVLIQFPASIKSDCVDQLRHLLDLVNHIDPDNEWKIAIEFRDSSWYNEETIDLIGAYRSTMVLHDKSGALSPHLTPADTVYVRFHGPEGNYRGSYTDAFLFEYATYINEWLAEGKSVFVYFNNTMGTAFHDLRKLNDYVEEMGT